MTALKTLSRRYPLFAVVGAAFLTVAIFLAWPPATHAAGVDPETQFVLNTFAFLIWGALVMWMCAGFTMLEAGSVRTKNASMICLKNIGLYSVAGLAFYFVGYNLMYTDVWHIIGVPNNLYESSVAEKALLGGSEGQLEAVLDGGYSVMSDWFFQMVFVATAASIVSGALAERVRMWTFFLFVLLLTGFIYPVVGAWTWGGGWLSELGFSDFAGSTHRAQHRRLGGAGRADCAGAAFGQVPAGRDGAGHAAVQCGAGDAGGVHTLAGMVRFQRRFATGAGQRAGCGGDGRDSGEYQSGGGSGGDCGADRVASAVRSD